MFKLFNDCIDFRPLNKVKKTDTRNKAMATATRERNSVAGETRGFFSPLDPKERWQKTMQWQELSK